jgi:recombinational DNA repair protein (RecF pathway)
MLAAGVEPTVGYPGAKAPWTSRCLTCGRNVTPRYSLVKAGGGACAYCARQRVDPDEAADVMRAAGVEPLVAYPGHAAS